MCAMNINSNKKYPRVLIISHNPLSDTEGSGKTLSSFFRQWDNDNLAQLYLTTSVPDFTICKKFFQINDIDIIKRVFFSKHLQGRRVTYSDLTDMKIYKNKMRTNFLLKVIRKNFSPFFRLFIDLLWDLADYKTRKLIRFVDEFKPQIVFFQSSNSVMIFSLAKWICEERNIPLIMQTTDDYVSGKFTLDPFFWIQQMRLRKAYKWAASYSDGIFAIGDKMADEYRLRFGGNYFVAMNSTDHNLPIYTPVNKTIKFLYTGNLLLNRWKVLALIAECLEELHHEEGLDGELSIFSLFEPGTKELSLLNRPPFSLFKGALNTNELNGVKTHSDVLVHVEAFDRKHRHLTRLSISTKIPEYLAAGRCIFAVGPEDVASMQYLAEYKLGVTVMSDNKSNIKEALKELMVNSEKRTQYAEKGREVAHLRHNADKTAENIFRNISTTINKRQDNALRNSPTSI